MSVLTAQAESNIGDAMRWVMGEQSSKALRGEKMAGVIFHGTQTRPKAPFAQVTITIDNEDGALEYDSDTVSVSRKLYRNGDSFYMINGKEVNLKDIVELFMDTGLGRDGYSIIGQGRIADIVNGKSNSRNPHGGHWIFRLRYLLSCPNTIIESLIYKQFHYPLNLLLYRLW